jgi:hypothetical protein
MKDCGAILCTGMIVLFCSCLSSLLCGWPLGFGYFVDMFKNRVGNYIERLVKKKKPKKVWAG